MCDFIIKIEISTLFRVPLTNIIIHFTRFKQTKTMSAIETVTGTRRKTIGINSSQANPNNLDQVVGMEADTTFHVACDFNGSDSAARGKADEADLMNSILALVTASVEGFNPNDQYVMISEMVANDEVPAWIGALFPSSPAGQIQDFAPLKFTRWAPLMKAILTDDRFSIIRSVITIVFDNFASCLGLPVETHGYAAFAAAYSADLCSVEREVDDAGRELTFAERCPTVYPLISDVAKATLDCDLTTIMTDITLALNVLAGSEQSYAAHSDHGSDGSLANQIKVLLTETDLSDLDLKRFSVDRFVQMIFDFPLTFYKPNGCLLDNQAVFRIMAELLISLTATGTIDQAIERLGAPKARIELLSLIDQVKTLDPTILFKEYDIVLNSDCEADDLKAALGLSLAADAAGSTGHLKIIFQIADPDMKTLYAPVFEHFADLGVDIDIVYNDQLTNKDKQTPAFVEFIEKYCQ